MVSTISIFFSSAPLWLIQKVCRDTLGWVNFSRRSTEYLANVGEFNYLGDIEPIEARGKIRSEALSVVEASLQARIEKATSAGERLPKAAPLSKPSAAIRRANPMSLAFIPALTRLKGVYVAEYIAKGTDNYDDPIDIIVDPGPDALGVDIAMLQRELWDIFGRQVEIESLENVIKYNSESGELLDGMEPLLTFICKR